MSEHKVLKFARQMWRGGDFCPGRQEKEDVYSSIWGIEEQLSWKPKAIYFYAQRYDRNYEMKRYEY